MSAPRSFPVLVFLALLAAVESTILVAARATRPPNIAVTHGVTSSPTADERLDSAAVDAFMIDNLRRMRIPGAWVAVARAGRILHTAGYGHTSQGPVTPDTPMPIASLTKSFTAAAVMMLVEEDRIVLDTPVREYLPDFELADPRSARITVRHLLNQTSGLTNPRLPPTSQTLPDSLTGQIEWLRAATLASDPGAAFHYCNENYNVLALLVERLSGAPFATVLEDRLFAPLGMTDSHFVLTSGEPMPGVVPGFELAYGARIVRRTPYEFVGAGGGIISTARDLARWLAFQSAGGTTLAGERLLSPESMAAMHTASAPGGNYGFGWREDTLPDGTKYLHHSGKLPPFVAHERLYLGTGYAFAFTLNGHHSFNAEAASFMAGLNEIFAGRTPVIGPPFTFFGLPFGLIVDNLVAILTVLALTVGLVGAVRARTWTARRAGGSVLLAVLRCLPYALVAGGAAVFPWLMAGMNRGQPVPWDVMFSVWPALVVLVAISGVAAASVVVVRGIHVAQALARADGGSGTTTATGTVGTRRGSY